MKIGVIGSGSIGPDLAYGFASALSRGKPSEVWLVDIKQEALDAGIERIRGYIGKGISRGKLNPKAAKAIESSLKPTMDLKDLAGCEYVLEAASEDLPVKQGILKNLEEVVGPDCLIGFATSGIPRARIAAEVKHPERCFVNHPFYPAWRALPVEVVPSGDEAMTARMMAMLKRLGKVPIITSDVPCFAADDIFCCYCTEAVRIMDEGIANPYQIDAIVNDAIGGGGAFNVMDLTRGNLLGVHCMELMREAPTGSDWFTPPDVLEKQGNKPWIDHKNPGDATYDEALKRKVLDRMLAVLVARSYFVVDNGICAPTDLDWLTRMALGFKKGTLSLAEGLGAGRVKEICETYAAEHPGFEVPKSVADCKLAEFYRNIKVERDGEIAVVTVFRPEVKNALNGRTIDELAAAFGNLAEDDAVRGVVLTSFDGSLAGADIMELARLRTAEEAAEKARHGQRVLDRISAMSKPVVAALDGAVLGGGAELSMACHARVVGRGLMMGQPEVNLGIIPGYGGTQRLPRIVGFEKAAVMLRNGLPVGAEEACKMGWATGDVAADAVQAARELVSRSLKGDVELSAVSAEPMAVPQEWPAVDLRHRSRKIDDILIGVIRDGLAQPLAAGLEVEAEAFGRCRDTIDYDIGMKNFIVNGPRVPAAFMHE